MASTNLRRASSFTATSGWTPGIRPLLLVIRGELSGSLQFLLCSSLNLMAWNSGTPAWPLGPASPGGRWRARPPEDGAVRGRASGARSTARETGAVSCSAVVGSRNLPEAVLAKVQSSMSQTASCSSLSSASSSSSSVSTISAASVFCVGVPRLGDLDGVRLLPSILKYWVPGTSVVAPAVGDRPPGAASWSWWFRAGLGVPWMACSTLWRWASERSAALGRGWPSRPAASSPWGSKRPLAQLGRLLASTGGGAPATTCAESSESRRAAAVSATAMASHAPEHRRREVWRVCLTA
mmetsp:Transcript_96298/g.287405  ORF Transcript_96298/g.287405 Transcript_96298/m.287405 type:complete len:295 (+) Transcript_96298:66-950(+)